MDINYGKIGDCTVALLYLVTSEGNCGARAMELFEHLFARAGGSGPKERFTMVE
jgi:hypothetical protein